MTPKTKIIDDNEKRLVSLTVEKATRDRVIEMQLKESYMQKRKLTVNDIIWMAIDAMEKIEER